MPAKKNNKKMDLSRDIEEVVRPRENESRGELVLPESGSSFAKIAFTFIGLAIVLILGVLYFSYFYTTLIITPNKQAVETNFEVQIMLLDKIKEEAGELGDVSKMLGEWSKNNPEKLAGEVLMTKAEKEKTYKVTGEGGEEKPGTAHGKIKIFNKQNVAQDLVAKTRFQAENEMIFRIREAVRIAANSEAVVEVFADTEGEKGNIGPTKFILPGFSSEAKRKAVYAESYEPMTDGVIKEKILTQEDINKAKEELEKELQAEALIKLDGELKTLASEEQKLPTETEGSEAEETSEKKLWRTYEQILPQAVVYKTVDVKIEPEIGTKTEDFKMKLGVEATAILFSEDNLLTLAKLKMAEKENEGQKIAMINDEELTYAIKNYDEELGLAVLEAGISGEGYLTSAELLGKLELKSLEAEDIQTYLDAHPEIANIEIKEAPIWMRKLPILKDRVRVKVALPE